MGFTSRGFYGSWVFRVVGFTGRRFTGRFYGSSILLVGFKGRRFYKSVYRSWVSHIWVRRRGFPEAQLHARLLQVSRGRRRNCASCECTFRRFQCEVARWVVAGCNDGFGILEPVCVAGFANFGTLLVLSFLLFLLLILLSSLMIRIILVITGGPIYNL